MYFGYIFLKIKYKIYYDINKIYIISLFFLLVIREVGEVGDYVFTFLINLLYILGSK